MTSGSTAAEVDWNVPTVMLPTSPLRNRSIRLLAASTRDSRSRAASSISMPSGVSSTGLGPPGRSNSLPSTTRSRAAICWLIADCV